MTTTTEIQRIVDLNLAFEGSRDKFKSYIGRVELFDELIRSTFIDNPKNNKFYRGIRLEIDVDLSIYRDDQEITGLQTVFIMRQDTMKAGKICISPTNNWKEVQRKIHTTLERLYKFVENNGEEPKEDCDICFEPNEQKIICSKCSKLFCCSCYINLLEKGKGVLVCPFCRHKSGSIMSKKDLHFFIFSKKVQFGLED